MSWRFRAHAFWLRCKLRFPRERSRAIWVSCLMLALSGSLGMYHWPPPSLKAYTSVIDWTNIEDGRVGAVVRIMLAIISVVGWCLPWPLARLMLYGFATSCCGLLMSAFAHVGQGFAQGAWLVGFVYGAIAMYHESQQVDWDMVWYRIDKAITCLILRLRGDHAEVD